jgi:hypothetical protein
MIIDSGLVTGSLQVIGNTTMTGSLSVTGDINGTLKGTAQNATSASYAVSASFAQFAATPTVQGVQGLQGRQGTSGVNGSQGTQGIQGLQGLQGRQGTSGVNGSQGTQGIQGLQGLQGTTGIQGTSGTNGSQGTSGTNGAQGIQGILGNTGAQGTTGASIQGTTGQTGAQGTTGSTGSQGTTGSTGSQGVTGTQGTTGATGAQGTAGSNGAQGATGAQGSTGSQGVQGTQGIQGTNAGITSYTNASDNRVLTSVNSSTINAESNLTFDGTNLGVSGGSLQLIPGTYGSNGFVAFRNTANTSTRWNIYNYTNGGTTYGSINFSDGAGTDRVVISEGGSTTFSTDARAPIFYDSNNTGYYLDPASTSNLNAVNFSTLYSNRSGASGNVVVIDNAGSSTWPFIFQTSAVGNDNASGFWTSDVGYPDMRLRKDDGTVRALISSWERSYTTYGLTDATDMRAPIFYDTDNTGYYLNPASTSYLNVLSCANVVNGAFLGVSNTSNSSGNGISLYNGGGSGQPTYGLMFAGTPTFGTHGSVSGDWATYFTMNDDSSRGWIFKRGTTNVASISGGGILQTTGYIYASTYVQSGQSMYSPIYYDANDSAYYTDPNSTTTSARIAGSVFSDGAFGSNGHSSGGVTSRVFAPKGAAYSYTPGIVAGAIKIRLPNRANDTMWSMKVRIYNYQTNQTAEYLLGNYSYSAGAYNFSATYLGGESSVAQAVRFGNQGGYDCVWIGETSTVWTHPVVSVMDFMGGYSNGSAGNWNNGWEISLVTSFGTVAATQAPNINFNEVYSYSYRGNGNVGGTGAASWHPSGIYCGSTMWQYGAMYKNNTDIHDIGTGYSNASLRAPIFYDNNNTGYYIDPAGNSQVSAVYANNWFRAQGNTGLYGQDYGIHFYPQSTTAWSITGSGGNIELQFRSNHNSTIRGYVYADTSNNIGFLTSGGGWRLRCDDSGNAIATGDVTAYSDRRVKENIHTIDNALDKVNNLRGVYYTRIDSEDKQRKVGVIAQEILEVLPEVVGQDTDGMYNVAYGNITAVLIEAIKEQQTQIDELKQLVKQLTNK